MHNSFGAGASVQARPWRYAALSFIALSAAIDVDLLEEKDEQGKHLFSRGRHKYYGIGCLVIFFALFSGYGMGHMLATMSTISIWGASIAGVVWACFQWCLERQMLISIRADAKWWQKLVGLSWRSLLALLSASTMVYPFFVESNRAEIEVKVGEMARVRLLDNLNTASVVAGLPALRQDAIKSEESIRKVEVLLAGDPPELGGLRQKSKLCWARFQEEANQIQRQLRPLQALAATMGADAMRDSKIIALQRKLSTARTLCVSADNLVVSSLLAWKQQKTVEKNELLIARKKLQDATLQATQKEQALADEQASKIISAAHSGFAADFAAVAEMLRNDANRRFQLLWWLVWFLAIEMVAILVKFTTTTDIDWRLSRDEELTDIKTRLHAELALPVAAFKASLAQLEELERLSLSSSLTQNNPQLLHMLEQAIARVLESFTLTLRRNATVTSG